MRPKSDLPGLLVLISIAAVLAGIAVGGLGLSGCGPKQPVLAAEVRDYAVALAYGRAYAALSYFDGQTAAEYRAKSQAVTAELGASGGTMEDYDRVMDEWSERSGWQARADRIIRAANGLRLVREYLSGEAGDKPLEQALDVLEALALLTEEAKAQGLDVPPRIDQSIQAAQSLVSLMEAL